MTDLPVLVVEHEATCPPGWCGEWLEAAGVPLDVCRPYAGQDLPDRLDGHRSLLVLGGSMGAYDDSTCGWLPHVKGLFRAAAADRVPALGICLGHQIAAVALGGHVERNPRGQQIGVVDVGWTPGAAEDPLLGPLTSNPAGGPVRAVQWNNDVVDVPPPGSEVLARAATGELQAARLAPTVWGVQWHPEAGADIIATWVEEDRDQVQEGDLRVDDYLARVAAARDEMRATWRPLAEGFGRLTRAEAPVS